LADDSLDVGYGNLGGLLAVFFDRILTDIVLIKAELTEFVERGKRAAEVVGIGDGGKVVAKSGSGINIGRRNCG